MKRLLKPLIVIAVVLTALFVLAKITKRFPAALEMPDESHSQRLSRW